MSEEKKSKTGCVCPNAGFCERHKINKTPHLHKLCQNHQPTFDRWEACQGPGQQNINCKKDDKNISEAEVESAPQEVSPPSLIKQAGSFIRAATKHVVNGMKNVTPEEKERRLNICEQCPHLRKNGTTIKCGQCGCNLHYKAAMSTSTCPLGHW